MKLKKADVREYFGKSYIDTCTSIIDTLEHSNELKDIYAQQTRVDQLKDRFINALEKEKAKQKKYLLKTDKKRSKKDQ